MISSYDWSTCFDTGGIWWGYAFANYKHDYWTLSAAPFRPFGMKDVTARKDEEGRWVIVVHGENGAKGELVFSKDFGRIDEAYLAGELIFEWDKHKDRKINAVIVEDGVVKPVPPPPTPPPLPPGSKARQAIGKGDHAEVRRLLDAGEVGIDEGVWKTQTLTILAADAGDAALLEELIERGADVNAANGSGRTALMYAIGHGGEELIAALLAAGADPDAVDDNGWNALHHGFSTTGIPVGQIGALLDAGADIEARREPGGNTPLLEAASRGREDLVELLIEKGADTAAKTRTGWDLERIRAHRRQKAEEERSARAEEAAKP